MPGVPFLLRAPALAVSACVALTLAVPATAAIGEYRYAGLVGSDRSSGVRARLVSLVSPRVADGHVAAWVGVGGDGAGPAGDDEWLQVGLASFRGTSTRLYYELVRGETRRYVELDATVRVGEARRVAVAETSSRPGWWRVWVDGRPVTRPIHLPSSHLAWDPMAMAESWGEGEAENAFHFRFRELVTRGRSRRWQTLREPYVLEDPGLRVVRPAGRGFDALRGSGAAAR